MIMIVVLGLYFENLLNRLQIAGGGGLCLLVSRILVFETMVFKGEDFFIS